jgi:hypothetical protein
MISGAHSILYSTDAEADRAFLRDVLKLPHVDVGGGWLIFGLPPAEVAVHPGEENDVHELYLMCDDVEAFMAEMKRAGVVCGPAMDRDWGRLTQVTLPGGGKLGVYQPRHARPKAMTPETAAKAAPRRTAARPGSRKSAARTRPKSRARAPSARGAGKAGRR